MKPWEGLGVYSGLALLMLHSAGESDGLLVFLGVVNTVTALLYGLWWLQGAGKRKEPDS